MKNQYFGDVRDYLKYSLLRSLGRELSVAVCWLLTEDDLSADGRIVSYLEKPDRWRAFDPLVYDFLRLKVLEEKQRRVDVLHKAALLGDNCRLFSETVPVDDLERCRYFDRFMEYADGTGLTFFDPDTGIEPASTKGPKYVHWHELDRAFRQGHSLLIYQHFARGGKHDPFVEGKAEQLGSVDIYIILSICQQLNYLQNNGHGCWSSFVVSQTCMSDRSPTVSGSSRPSSG